MKNNKLAKMSLLVLSLVLVIGTLFVMSAGAEETTTAKTPEIISQNIKYKDKFCLMYAVDASGITGPVTLYLYDTEPTDDTSPIRTYTVDAATPAAQNGNLDKDAYIFVTEGVSYTAMDKNFYVVAEASGVKSAPKRYSVAEYFYQRLADKSASASQKKFYQDTIEFGAGVQTHINNVTNENELVTALRYVVVEGGTLDGKYTAGLYPTGTVVAPAALGVSSWNVAVYDAEGNATVTNDVSSFKIPTTEGVSKILFTTGNIITYREGYNNLDNATDLASVNMGYKTWNSVVTGSLVPESGRGQVAKFDYTGSGSAFAWLYKNNSIVSEANATAFEISFDIKATTSGKTANESFELQLLNTKEEAPYRFKIFTYFNGSDADLVVSDCSTADGRKTFSGVKATEWYNVRVVGYKDNPNLYVYINGSDDPFIDVHPQSGASLPFDGVLTNINGIGILTRDNNSLSIKIDNVFVGYTEDTLTGN